MLRYEITLKNGEVRSDLRVLTAGWKSELDVPADSLVLSCAYDPEIFDQGDRIAAYDGDRLIFEGQLDELSRVHMDKGLALKLCARSAAAVLLDNEAEPLSYRNPTAALMYYKHLEPFGLTDVEFDLTPVLGYMRIDKGMTQWQAVERFCKIRYGSKLRISGSGKVYLKGFKSDKKVKFGDGGIEYYSIIENKCRHKLISEVKLKVSKTAGYLSTMKNPNPESKFIKRVRYVNASAENNTLSTADNIIERGNFDSRYIKLNFKGCVTDILGASAEIKDKAFGNLSGLTVRAISYALSQNGEFTTVVLGENDREENV